MARNWSHIEVKEAVEDYFNMLQLELKGHRYNKTKHRRALMESLKNNDLTIRDRNTMKQERVKIKDLIEVLNKKLNK